VCAVSDPAATAFMRTAIHTTGVPVTMQRVFGYAPAPVWTFSADLTARVAKVAANRAAPARDGLSATAPGALTQDDRTVRLMADELAAERFPLPVAKGDKIILAAGGEAFEVSEVDDYTFAFAGAIELTVTGVA
jgi:hypothetical protein